MRIIVIIHLIDFSPKEKNKKICKNIKPNRNLVVLIHRKAKKGGTKMKDIIRDLLTKQIKIGSISVNAGTIVATVFSVIVIGGTATAVAVNQLSATEPPVKAVVEEGTEIDTLPEQEPAKEEQENQNQENVPVEEEPEEIEDAHYHTFSTEIIAESTCQTQGEAVDTCTDCGYSYSYNLQLSQHISGEWIVKVEATETAEGLKEQHCKTCNTLLATEVIAVIPHNHNYVVSGSKNPSCSEDGYTAYSCSICDSSYIETVGATGHDYSEQIIEEATFDKEGHIYKKCSKCGDVIQTGTISKKEHSYGEWEITKEATCTEDGEKKRTCSDCGVEDISVIKATGHKFTNYEIITEATEENEGLEKAVCDNCDAEDERIIAKIPHIHDYATEIERVEPTCTKDGYYILQCRCEGTLKTDILSEGHSYELTDHKDADCIFDGADTYTCSKCTDAYSDVIAAKGHTSGAWEVIKEASDLEEGQKVRKCADCGTTLETQTISKLPHTCEQNTLLEEQEATCTTDGYKLYECRCGLTDKVILPKTNHSNNEWKTVKEATYTEMGLEQKICLDCEYIIESKDIAVLPHEHDYKTTESVNPTCTEAGKTVETCDICGNTKTEVLNATGHKESGFITDKEATCLAAGEQHTECSVCQITLKTETIPATGHLEGSWIVDKDASCTEDGSKHTECGNCGTTISTETITSTGHSMGDWQETNTAGCESDGAEERNCSKCSYSENRSIPPTGHNYGDWIVDEEPTEESEGSKHKECADCDSVITEDIEQLPPHVHSYSETSRTDSTCTNVGSVTYSCDCGDSYSEEIAKKSHTSGDWIVETAPTEEATGLEVKKCTECGTQTDSRIIDKLEHVHNYTVENKGATCTVDGYEKQTCGCGSVINTVIPATGHKYGTAVVVDPTCTQKGTSTITCETCGNKEVTDIPKTAHNYVESEKEAATCDKEGSVTYKCTNCQDSYSEEVEQLEHEYSVTSTVNATCTVDGYTIETCKNCGDTVKTSGEEATGHDNGEWNVVKEAELGVAGSKELRCTKCNTMLDSEEIEMLLTDGTDSVYYITVKNDDGTKTEQMVIGHYDTEEANEMFDLINDYRVENGLTALELKTGYMVEYTDLRAAETSYLWDHARPAGWATECAENIAMGTPDMKGNTVSVEEIFNAWVASEGHRTNILTPFTKNWTAVSVFYKRCPIAGTDRYVYEAYWVQTFK